MPPPLVPGDPDQAGSTLDDLDQSFNSLKVHKVLNQYRSCNTCSFYYLCSMVHVYNHDCQVGWFPAQLEVGHIKYVFILQYIHVHANVNYQEGRVVFKAEIHKRAACCYCWGGGAYLMGHRP